MNKKSAFIAVLQRRREMGKRMENNSIFVINVVNNLYQESGYKGLNYGNSIVKINKHRKSLPLNSM